MTPCSSLTITLSDAKSDNSIPGGDVKGCSCPPATALWTRLAIGRRLPSIIGGTGAHLSQGGAQMAKESLTADRLGQIGMGTAPHGAQSGRRIDVRRNDDDGY